jgi:hypothetical protein
MATVSDLNTLIETIGPNNAFVKGAGFYENEVGQYATSSYEYVNPFNLLKFVVSASEFLE